MKVEFEYEEYPFPYPRSEIAASFIRALTHDGTRRLNPSGITGYGKAWGSEVKVSLTENRLLIESDDAEVVLRLAEGIVRGGWFSDYRPAFPITRKKAIRRAVNTFSRAFEWSPIAGLRARWWFEFGWAMPGKIVVNPSLHTVVPLSLTKRELERLTSRPSWEDWEEFEHGKYKETECLGKEAVVAVNPDEREAVVVIKDTLDRLTDNKIRDLAREILFLS